MTERVFPYDPLETCDECGQLGAFDFYGDYYCTNCLREFNLEEEDEEWLEE